MGAAKKREQAQHTPGPWRAQGFHVVEGRRSTVVAEVFQTASRHKASEVAANAALISAAPEALEVLADLLDIASATAVSDERYEELWAKYGDGTDGATTAEIRSTVEGRAREVLAKARGES
jgi:hypothetical protein